MGVRRPERVVHSPPPSAEVKMRYTFTCSECLHSAVLMQAHGQAPQFPQAVGTPCMLRTFRARADQRLQ